MKIKVRDMEAACDEINGMDPLDLNEEDDTINPLFKWIRPAQISADLNEEDDTTIHYSGGLGLHIWMIIWISLT